MTRPPAFLLLLGFAGCALLNPQQGYYENGWHPPTVSSLSSTSEVGNLGGGTLEIQGSGFGTDPTQLVVLFGEHNAELLDVADDRLTVRVPNGPITGGAVEVKVAGKDGYVSAPEPYVYEVGTVPEGEVGFVQVNNYWESCYGGLSGRLDDEWGNVGCTDIAYLGYVGIDGTADRYKFPYPRVHTELQGFMSGTDLGDDRWYVERPGQISFSFGVDDLHDDIGPITLHSPFWADEDPEACADVDSMAVFRYGGGQEGFNSPDAVSASPNGIPFDIADVDNCEDKGGVLYDASTMEFCTSDDAEGIPTHTYRSDWPVTRNFFAGHATKLKPTTVLLDAPGVGIAGQEISVPESIVVSATQGFELPTSTATEPGDLWALLPMLGCFDDRTNGEDLGDTAIEFTWQPSKFDFTQNGVVVDSTSFVRVTLTTLSLNWFGTTSYPARATVSVPDAHDVDADGLSHLEIPAEVMYQLPSVRTPAGAGYLDSTIHDWGYLVIEVQRVTEYTLATEQGNVVFSYVTGDFGFTDWTNPTEADGCHNCLDDDEDGWADGDDPDCAAGAEEVGFGDTRCNDGTDNDRDGLTDVEDDFCVDALDDDESNCDNNRDDDRDGLTDGDDPECQRGRSEVNDDSPCGNGDDDDGDGWVDAEDPDCAAVGDEVGFGTTACNNGEDDDGDSLIDAEDPSCEDASGASEQSDTGG